MKLIIVSGQEGTDVESLFEKVISENGYVYQYAPKMVFPENSMLLRHPRALYNNVRKVVRKHIENGQDLFVLTFSDYAMYGIRVEIKKNDFEGAIVHQLKNDGEDIISEMNPETAKYEYVDGIFYTIDKALNELLWG